MGVNIPSGLLVALVLTLSLAIPSVNADYLWIGGGTTDWVTQTNWLNGNVPSSSVDVGNAYINTSATINVNWGAAANNLKLSAATLSVAAFNQIFTLGGDLVISDDATINGHTAATILLEGGIRVTSGSVAVSSVQLSSSTLLPVTLSSATTLVVDDCSLMKDTRFQLGNESQLMIAATLNAYTSFNGSGVVRIIAPGITRASNINIDISCITIVAAGSILALSGTSTTGVTTIRDGASMTIIGDGAESVTQLAGLSLSLTGGTFFKLQSDARLSSTIGANITSSSEFPSPTAGAIIDGHVTHTRDAFIISTKYIRMHGPNATLLSSNIGYYILGSSVVRTAVSLYSVSLISLNPSNWWILRGLITIYFNDVTDDTGVYTQLDGISHVGANIEIDTPVLNYNNAGIQVNDNAILEISSSMTIRPTLRTSSSSSSGVTASPGSFMGLSSGSLLYTSSHSSLTVRGTNFRSSGSELRIINSGRILLAMYRWVIKNGGIEYGDSLSPTISLTNTIITGDGTGQLRFGERYDSVVASLYGMTQFHGGNITIESGSTLTQLGSSSFPLPTIFSNGGYFSDATQAGLSGRSTNNASLSINGAGTMSLYKIIINTTSTTSVTWSCMVRMKPYYYTNDWSYLLIEGASTLIIDNTFVIDTGTSGSTSYPLAVTVRFPNRLDGTRNNGSMIITKNGEVSIQGKLSMQLFWSGGTINIHSASRLSVDTGTTLVFAAFESNVTIVRGTGTIYVRYRTTSGASTLNVAANATLDASETYFLLEGSLVAGAQSIIKLGLLVMSTTADIYGVQYPTLKITAHRTLGFTPITANTCTLQGNLYILLSGFTTTTRVLLLSCGSKTSTSRFNSVLVENTNGLSAPGGVRYTSDSNGYSVWYDPTSTDTGDGTGTAYEPDTTARDTINEIGYSLLGITIGAFVLFVVYCFAWKPWHIRRQAQQRLQAIRAADGMDIPTTVTVSTGVRLHADVATPTIAVEGTPSQATIAVMPTEDEAL